MELTKCINYLLTTAQHTVSQSLNAKLSTYDITPSQYAVLRCLWEKEDMTPKQISERLFLENSTISGVLDRMKKKELIERITNPEDRREIHVTITQKGKELEKPIGIIIEEVNQKVLQGFSAEEIFFLKESLRKIANGK